MGDERSRRERLDEWLIRAAVKLNAWFSRLLKPGSLVIFLAASLFGVGALMKEADFPKKTVWESGSGGLIALLICGVVTYLGYVLVIWGYLRSLARGAREGELYRACRDVAALVERTTDLDRDNIGVHVWAVRGIRGAKRLERQATFVPGDRPPTAIVWRKGKGAIGRCWDRDEWILADLEELHELAPTEEDFYALPLDERFYFTWPEFRSTDHYRAVLAWPLHGGPEAAPKVVGCMSIDVQESGAAAELDDFKEYHRGLFAEHLAVCEAVLRGN